MIKIAIAECAPPDHREPHKYLRSFFKSRKNGTIVFHLSKETRHELPFFIDMLIISPAISSALSWWQDIHKRCFQGFTAEHLLAKQTKLDKKQPLV